MRRERRLKVLRRLLEAHQTVQRGARSDVHGGCRGCAGRRRRSERPVGALQRRRRARTLGVAAEARTLGALSCLASRGVEARVGSAERKATLLRGKEVCEGLDGPMQAPLEEAQVVARTEGELQPRRLAQRAARTEPLDDGRRLGRWHPTQRSVGGQGAPASEGKARCVVRLVAGCDRGQGAPDEREGGASGMQVLEPHQATAANVMVDVLHAYRQRRDRRRGEGGRGRGGGGGGGGDGGGGGRRARREGVV